MSENGGQEEAAKIAQIGRAIVLAIAANEQNDPAQVGVSLDIEATLRALMFVAAGIIGQNINSRTPSEVRVETERLADIMKGYAASDRKAAERGGERLLDMLGATMAPQAGSNALN